MPSTVLITGAAKRIGKALSEFFAAKGWNVIIHCNSSIQAGEELSKTLHEKYPDLCFPVIQADLSDGPKSVSALFGKLPVGIEKIDALINNASVFEPGEIKDTSLSLWRNQLQINLETPFLLMQAFFHHARKGSIVNILDTRIVNNDSSYAAYSISKKGLMQLTRMAALEWAPKIRVNGVAPGPVLPPAGKDEAYFNEVAKNTPLKKTVELANLTKSAYFLISNNSVTGQILYCDSGEHLIH